MYTHGHPHSLHDALPSFPFRPEAERDPRMEDAERPRLGHRGKLVGLRLGGPEAAGRRRGEHARRNVDLRHPALPGVDDVGVKADAAEALAIICDDRILSRDEADEPIVALVDGHDRLVRRHAVARIAPVACIVGLSEARSAGKESVSTCNWWWSP